MFDVTAQLLECPAPEKNKKETSSRGQLEFLICNCHTLYCNSVIKYARIFLSEPQNKHLELVFVQPCFSPKYKFMIIGLIFFNRCLIFTIFEGVQPTCTFKSCWCEQTLIKSFQLFQLSLLLLDLRKITKY